MSVDHETLKRSVCTKTHYSMKTVMRLHDNSSYSSERFTVNVRFYPRDAMLARVFAIATCLSVRPSVRLSVCLSAARRYCA